MRLTHYEDGLLCGDRFCINLIRHCGDTFPDLGEGQGLVASDQTPEMNDLRRSNGGSKPPPYEIKPLSCLAKLN